MAVTAPLGDTHSLRAGYIDVISDVPSIARAGPVPGERGAGGAISLLASARDFLGPGARKWARPG
jgi:hypothetical protein